MEIAKEKVASTLQVYVLDTLMVLNDGMQNSFQVDLSVHFNFANTQFVKSRAKFAFICAGLKYP